MRLQNTVVGFEEADEAAGGVSGSLTWGIDGEGDARQLGIADHNDAAMSILASLTEL